MKERTEAAREAARKFVSQYLLTHPCIQRGQPAQRHPFWFKYNQAMAQIEVKKLRDFPAYESEVIVRDRSVTTHRVTVNQDYYEQLTGGAVPAEKLLKESFEFLLAREATTSILSEFDLAVISRYFPDYVQEMKRISTSR